MCLIVIKYPNAVIIKRDLKRYFNANPDGVGFMWAANNKLNVHKGFMHFRKFYKNFRQQERLFPDSCFVIHFSIRATGRISPENTHPVFVNDNLAIVHNGVISGLGSTEINDTHVFAAKVLAKLPNDFLDNLDIKKAIEKLAVATSSKFVLLDNTGKLVIFNEKAGCWEDKKWFSNNTYKFEYYNGYIGCYDKYNYFGFSDDEKYSHSSARRACVICNVRQSLTGMDWSNNKDGWVCESCQRLIADYDDDSCTCANYKCTVCKDKFDLADGIYKSRNFYCYSCWTALKACFNINCPYCGSSILLDWKDRCSICNQIIDEEDYAPQLIALEYLN